MTTPFSRRRCLLLLPLAVLTLSGCEGIVGSGALGAHRAVAWRELPDVSSAQTDCRAANFANFPRVKQIYDEFFHVNEPVSFGWSTDSRLTAEFVQRVSFQSVSLDNKEAHRYFSFSNCIYERSGGTNERIFAEFDATRDVHAAYRRFNPRDWIPATATTYARSESRDVIANQFVYRVACFPEKMRDALARCPDCDDVFVPLSKHDMYKIFEVRFARVNEGALQVSRVFKFIGIDSSGAMSAHAAKQPYPFASLNGETLRAKWRGEISGRLYQALRESGSVAIFMRSSAASEYGCGSSAPEPEPPAEEPPAEEPPAEEPPAEAEPPASTACAEQRGVCAGAVQPHPGSGCTSAVYRDHAASNGDIFEAEESLCDDKDNDCDGDVDEGCEPTGNEPPVGNDPPALQSHCIKANGDGSDRFTASDGILYECWKHEDGWAQVWRSSTWQKWNQHPVDGPNCNGWLSNSSGNSLAWLYCRPESPTASEEPPASGGNDPPVLQSDCIKANGNGSNRFTASDGILYECWKYEDGWAQVWRSSTWQKWNHRPVDGLNCNGWLSNSSGNSLAWLYCRPDGPTAAASGDFLPVGSATADVQGGCAMAPGASASTGLGLLLLFGLLALARRRSRVVAHLRRR